MFIGTDEGLMNKRFNRSRWKYMYVPKKTQAGINERHTNENNMRRNDSKNTNTNTQNTNTKIICLDEQMS